MNKFIDVSLAQYAPDIKPPTQGGVATGNEIRITINDEVDKVTTEKICQKIIDELNKNKPKGHGYMIGRGC
jgi:hypothetical protein